jgi:DedD protein
VAHTQDEGFHEIQLNGKQLVFLFMAATVVSVVIFLCGVLVGRGVRAERSASVDATLIPSLENAPQPQAAEPPPTAPGSDPTKAAPPAPADDLTYFNRLEKPNTAPEKLKSATEKPAPAPAPALVAEPPPAPKPAAPAPKPAAPAPKPAPPVEAKATPAPPPAPPAAPPKATSVSNSEPSGSGFVVQIAALRLRNDAEAIAKQLSAKGYAAYVVPPPAGTPPVFRVRVGKFPTRREAETVANKLQKEEQFKPFITR